MGWSGTGWNGMMRCVMGWDGINRLDGIDLATEMWASCVGFLIHERHTCRHAKATSGGMVRVDGSAGKRCIWRDTPRSQKKTRAARGPPTCFCFFARPFFSSFFFFFFFFFVCVSCVSACLVCTNRSFRFASPQVELDVLKRVSHKHILALIGAGLREEQPHRFLVLEVCGGDGMGCNMV